MNRFAKFAPLLVLLSLCLGFGMTFHYLLMAFILEPIAVSLWLAWQLVLTLDQSVYWTLAVLVCAVWIVRVLPPRWHTERDELDKDEQQPNTCLARWQELLEAAEGTTAGDAVLRTNLRELLASVIGKPSQSSPAELAKALVLERIELPPSAQRYLFPDQTPNSWASIERIRNAFARASRWARAEARGSADEATRGISELLDFMESTMEIRNDQK